MIRLQSSLAPRLTLGLMLAVLVLPGCASARKLAWNPLGDRIKDRENRYNFAQVMERSGDIHRAEASYRKLSEEAPKDAKYYQRLGVVMVRQGKNVDGIAMLLKAHDLDEENIAIMNDLGYAYMVEGEFEKAEVLLRKAMKLDARDVRTQNNLAMTLGYMGKTEEAYQLFRRNADEGTARNNLAYIYAQTGHVDLAVKEYSRALTHEPGNKAAAEAIVQLNTLNRNLAAIATPAKKTPLTAERAFDHEQSEASVTQPVKNEQDSDATNDLVQLLGNVELEEVEVAEERSEEPPAITIPEVGKATVRSPAFDRDDYDWSSAP
jgi:Flp pilus assembly protein TadD